MSDGRPARTAPVRLRRLRQVLSWVLPLASFVVILLVLRGAGVPLSVPGVVVVLVVLAVARVVGARSRRRRRRDRALTPPDRSR
ncbi:MULTISPECIES: hypothetical protein [Microbacterium]|uniref:hypothetical protein n=1 Tax=Microbacterium TaxID=33882 RepID=UPI0006FBD6B6|nr:MULTISPECIES: hypothetical protein [Microbacterium]KQR21429.1 hypothetical protein ASF76_14360 [Microbacterium sp. Leaf151]MCI9857470.1 hypothetical protein [Microbacterium proteolyticum]